MKFPNGAVTDNGDGTASISGSATNVGIGTTGKPVIYTSSTTAGPSAVMNEVGGNIGIGTTTPQGAFTVTNGNVGIGTWSPSYPLDVQAVTGQALIKSTTGTNFAVLRLNNSGNELWIGRNGSAGGELIVGGSPYASVINSNGASPFQLGVNNAIAMTVLSGGNIGIGTTTPQGGLTVTNGNVGIGTWAPAFGLQVVGNVGIGTTTVNSTPYAININNVATFNGEFTYASNIGIGTSTINWNNGNYQNIGIGTASGAYLAFTHPTNGNAAKLQLRIKQDATGSRVIDFWPGTILWSGGTAPTLTTTANKSDIITCFWNGTSDFCVPTANF